jgi:hypothetical protein
MILHIAGSHPPICDLYKTITRGKNQTPAQGDDRVSHISKTGPTFILSSDLRLERADGGIAV